MERVFYRIKYAPRFMFADENFKTLEEAKERASHRSEDEPMIYEVTETIKLIEL